ncbi:unnamed protein product [Oppiella nova]|uniref:Malate dehydrogenase (quinone) n=1 Tax=Oppiella nova TaxID=334625 RepID=A0A7R9L7J9_9ACAR|nr:unnamed protein product [Oppiella nova]CAG2157115.1 unnamed protein product [Oppiella nova]
MYERLDQVGQESSAGFNNAGTGHSGFMEMNYTPEKDGKVDIKKAIDTASQFETIQLLHHNILQKSMYVLFGPFATYSNKFLKNGSQFDLIDATNKNNVIPMATIGMENLDLVKYLVSQVAMSKQDQFNELKKYYPDAKIEDWTLSQAGQRVQIIKKAPGKPATLQFGTEIFTSKDGSITGLLGASPGASTSPYIMLSLMEKAFPEQVKGKWNPKLHEIVKSYQQDLNTNPALLDQLQMMRQPLLHLL